LQNPVKQQRQLGRRPVTVALGEPQHRVLHDVERSLLVVNGIDRVLESAALYALQKGRQLAAG
jgi:hypothetical protein